MKRAQRAYIFSIYGAMGGLLASFLHQNFLMEPLSRPLPNLYRFLYLGLLGGMVGAAIGFFASFSEGKASFSTGRAVRAGIIGALLGGIGGLIALPLSEALHIALGGGVKGRATALAILGLSVGIAEGIVGGARPWRGVIGGTLGGAFAGYVLESLLPYESLHADSGVVALMAIGLFICLIISLFVNVLAEAWLEGQPGSRVSGHIFHLGKFRLGESAVLGSDKNGAVFIWLPDAQPLHADITLLATGARIRHIAESGQTIVNGSPTTERLLSNGDLITIGKAVFKYRQGKRLALSSSSAALKKARFAKK